MRAVILSPLRNNPAQALQRAKSILVVVLNRDIPDALLAGPEMDALLQAPGAGTWREGRRDRRSASAAEAHSLALPVLLSCPA